MSSRSFFLLSVQPRLLAAAAAAAAARWKNVQYSTVPSKAPVWSYQAIRARQGGQGWEHGANVCLSLSLSLPLSLSLAVCVCVSVPKPRAIVERFSATQPTTVLLTATTALMSCVTWYAVAVIRWGAGGRWELRSVGLDLAHQPVCCTPVMVVCWCWCWCSSPRGPTHTCVRSSFHTPDCYRGPPATAS